MNFLKLVLFAMSVCMFDPAVAIEAGSAGQVLRVPSGGGKAKMGSLDLSAANATTNTLNATTKLSGLTQNSCLFGNSGGSIFQPSTTNCFWDLTNNALSLGANTLPNTSTILNIASTTKASIPAPKMTGTQRNAIASPIVGMQVFNTDTNQLNVYNGAAWVAVGSGSGGSKNYLASSTAGVNNADFETNSTSGWSLGTIGTLTNGLPTGSPTFGSGASGNLSITTVSSNQLAGSYSMSYVSSAATTAGNMVASSAFTIDKEDQNSVLTYSLRYLAFANPSNFNWTGTSSGSFAVAVYDVTNSSWLQVSNPFQFIQSSGVGSISGTFQTATNTAQLRFVVYTPNASAGAITMYFDDASVGPSSVGQNVPSVSMSVITSTTAATTSTPFIWPTVTFDNTASYSTSTGKFTCPVSGVYQINCNMTVSGNVSNFAAFAYVNGVSRTSVAISGGSGGGTNTLGSGSGIVVCNSGDTIEIRPNANATATGTNSLSIFQIAGAGVGPAGQVVAASAHITSAASTTSSNPFNFDTVDTDTTGSITTGAGVWNFKCPVSGYYNVSVFLYSSTNVTSIQLNKNGSPFRTIVFNNSTTQPSPSSTIIQCNAGDTLDTRPTATVTPTAVSASTLAQSAWISIFLLQGPSGAQNNTPTVSASYFCSANCAGTTTAPFNFDSKEFDDRNAVTTGVGWFFQAPISGLYTVTLNAYQTVGTASTGQIWKNTGGGFAVYKSISSGNTNYGGYVGSTALRLNAGDQIQIRPAVNVTIVGGTLANPQTSTLFIQRTGN